MLKESEEAETFGASRGDDAVMGDPRVVIKDPEPDKDSVGGHQQV